MWFFINIAQFASRVLFHEFRDMIFILFRPDQSKYLLNVFVDFWFFDLLFKALINEMFLINYWTVIVILAWNWWWTNLVWFFNWNFQINTLRNNFKVFAIIILFRIFLPFLYNRILIFVFRRRWYRNFQFFMLLP